MSTVKPFARIILPRQEGELSPDLEYKMRALQTTYIPRFYCPRDNFRAEATLGKGSSPDEISCPMCGGMWYGYLLHSSMQATHRARRSRERAERERIDLVIFNSQLRQPLTKEQYAGD